MKNMNLNLINSNLIFSDKKEKKNFSNSDTTEQSNHDNTVNTFNIELNEVFNEILIESNSLEDSSFHYEKSLSLIIRKYRIYTSEILSKISQFFNENSINYKLMVKCINEMNDIISEKNDIINLCNLFIPILIDKITHSKIEKIQSIEKINNCIERLSAAINIFNKKYLENLINKLLYTLLSDNNLNNNNIYAIIDLLSKLLKICVLFLFNKIESKTSMKKILKVIKYFKHNDKEIRFIVGELISSIFHLFLKRDTETKYYYLNLIYQEISEEYISNLKDNGNIPSDYNILSGYIIILRKYIYYESLFLKKIYAKLVDYLFRCKNSNNNENK